MVDLSTTRRAAARARAPSRSTASKKSAYSSVQRRRELDLALALMYFAFRKMIEEPDRLLAVRGLGRVHHRVLFFVARRPGLSVGELLSILAVSKQSLHGPMQKLSREGLLESRPHPKNRRIKRLFLTRDGNAFESRLSGIQRDLFRRAFHTRGRSAETAFRVVLGDVGEGRAEAVLIGPWTTSPTP
jgi:DNA-binding MarR family transcriptional regulator